MIRCLPNNECNATSIEYGLIAAIVVLGMLVGLRSLNASSTALWAHVGNQGRKGYAKPRLIVWSLLHHWDHLPVKRVECLFCIISTHRHIVIVASLTAGSIQRSLAPAVKLATVTSAETIAAVVSI